MKYSIGFLVEFVVINGALIFYIWKNRERFNGLAYYLHFGISLSGLILLVGATISEVLGFNNDIFQITGTVLLYWFVFLLISGGPLILVSSLLYWNDWFTKSKMDKRRKRHPKGYLEIEVV